jgi:hypothetical protein
MPSVTGNTYPRLNFCLPPISSQVGIHPQIFIKIIITMFSAASSRFRHHPNPAAAVPQASSYEVPFYTNAAYYPNWRIYQKQAPSSLRLGFISHVFYAFAW